jgi:hypothetical protein
MPTQESLNAAIQGLVESEECDGATLAQKEALFSSTLEPYDTLWGIVGGYIGQLFIDFMDWLANHTIPSDSFSTFLDDWFASVLGQIVPWPLLPSGGGE